jgi:serine/threonine protein kinase
MTGASLAMRARLRQRFWPNAYARAMPHRSEPDPRALQPGDAFGDYIVDEPLGEGGMGVVFRAIREDGAVVALKVLKPALVADEKAARRFAREARAADEVQHPHLIDVIDSGVVDGTGFLAMRFVAGRSLDDRIREHGPLPVEETAQIVAEIGSALDALHAVGLVHRDVKPSNILLDAERGALLTDFGLAKRRDYSMLTAPGQMLGTLDYIAPEMLKGSEPGPSADLYALGCVVFECLAGQPPFGGRSMFEVGMAHLGDAPPDPCAGRSDAPPELSQRVLAALAKEPGERPPSATAYAEMLLAAARSG